MLHKNNEDVEPEKLAALSGGGSASRPGSRAYHWRQPGLAARRCSPTSIDSALSRLTASVASIRAYLIQLKQLERWLNDRKKAIGLCLGQIRCIEKVVAGTETSPPLPEDCPPYILLVACYSDLARQALHGPSDEDTPAECSWSSTNGDQSDGDVKTSLTPDCLFGPLHDAAVAAGLSVLAATDQRAPAAALQVEGNDAVVASTTTDSLTTEQKREYTSLMSTLTSILPPVKKPGRKFADFLSSLTKSLYHLTRDALIGDVDNASDRRQQASSKPLDTAQLRSFTDFVQHSRPIVRVFSLPPDRRLVLSSADQHQRGSNASPVTHDVPSVLMEQLVDVVCADVTRRFQTETYGAHVVLEHLTRRLDTAPRTADSSVELA